jgi:hypothetical protein
MATKKIATIKTGKNGEPYLDFDKGNLRDLVKFLQEYGAKHLAGMETEEIWKAEKAKTMPPLSASCFKPKEGAPAWIQYDVVIKLAD